jgi:hypothetical protein
MKLSTKKGIVLALGLAFVQAGSAWAEPSYLIYPANAPAVFRYDTARYELVAVGDSKFDPFYAKGNSMIWDRVDQRVPVEIYHAPQLIGFEPGTPGMNEWVTYLDDFDIVIDGFGPEPRTIGNLCLRFWPYGANGAAQLSIDGVLAGNLTARLPALEVDTPDGNGYFVATRLHRVSWSGAQAMEIVAFSDKDNDGAFQGTPTYRIVARHSPVATANTSWGKVKALYR